MRETTDFDIFNRWGEGSSGFESFRKDDDEAKPVNDITNIYDWRTNIQRG